MEKILTVSVAAYNVSGFLKQTLESCLIPSMDELEVIVENDGSKDDTSSIAHEYEKKYPQTFLVVDKENGGYGSTINNSMQIARGKYFKQLDGDDWFNTEGLEKLVTFLKTCSADLVLSGRTEVNEKGVRKHSVNRWEVMYARTLNGKTVRLEELEPFVYGIWVVSYRTEMLRKHPFQLPEHQLYTDRMFITYPLPWIRTVSFLDYDVYCYRVGHEGQSVSKENRIKHSKEAIEGFEDLLLFYQSGLEMPERNRTFLRHRLFRYYKNVINTILLLPSSFDSMRKIKELDRRIKKKLPDLYKFCGENSKQIRLYRMSCYWWYWIQKLIGVKNWA